MFEACSCDSDGDTCDVWIHKVRKGRKDWKCCECREVIPKGAVHHYLKSLYDGDWSEDRWCVRCDQMRKDAAPCAPIGCLFDELRECYGEDVA